MLDCFSRYLNGTDRSARRIGRCEYAGLCAVACGAVLLFAPAALRDSGHAPGLHSLSHSPAATVTEAHAAVYGDSHTARESELDAAPAATKPMAVFASLLSGSAFESAVELYDRIYTDNDLEFSEPYRTLLLEHASTLNQDGRYAAAAELLQAYVAVYYSDVEALILLARVQRNSRDYLAAIESFQRARLNEHRHGVAQLIQNQANIVIGKYAQDMRDRNDMQGVTEFYQWLTHSQPSVAGYHIGLARAYAAQQRYDEAVGALRYVQHDARIGGKARSLISQYAVQSSSG